MKRREFFGTILGLSLIPFIGSKLEARSAEVPYEEPFQGYDSYIKKLGEHVGENVRVQDSFNLIGSGKRKFLGLERYDNSNTNLFPHRVSFDDGSTINLRNIASITAPAAQQVNIIPADESTLYLHIPAQRLHEEYMTRLLETFARDHMRFG